MYFPKQESSWPLCTEKGCGFEPFPQGLKIPGSISQTGLKDVVPASPPPAVSAEVSTQASGGQVGVGRHLST